MADFVCTRCGKPFQVHKRSAPTFYCPTCIAQMRAKAPRNPALDAQFMREWEHRQELARTNALRKR